MNYFAVLEFYQSQLIELYYRTKYGHSWRWYYLNWETGSEFLL